MDKLAKLKHLNALTLHGNPVENLPGFRHYILAKLPNLKHLNFSGISKAERQTALVYVKSNKMSLIANANVNKEAAEKKANKKKTEDDY